MICPCDTGHSYAECCALLHQGAQAQEPAAVMRARFSAFKLQLQDFVLASWHPDTRPAELRLSSHTRWGRLQIHQAIQTGHQGQVQFDAYFFEEGRWGIQQETSLFLKESGIWYYHSGEAAIKQFTPERNAPCPCGSGIKYKRCCLKRT